MPSPKEGGTRLMGWSPEIHAAELSAGGACHQHGVYDGRRCPECEKAHMLAQLHQVTWEATQWLSYDEVREYVENVLREVESDEP